MLNQRKRTEIGPLGLKRGLPGSPWCNIPYGGTTRIWSSGTAGVLEGRLTRLGTPRDLRVAVIVLGAWGWGREPAQAVGNDTRSCEEFDVEVKGEQPVPGFARNCSEQGL